ncbi:response regulator [Candidatus Nitrospira bockiana]
MTLGPIDILLIEDNPHDVELTLHAFQKHTLAKRIHVIRNGVEALDFLHSTGAYAGRTAEHNPKLILLDLKLPLVDGHYVLRQIRSDETARRIPVVILSSSREARDIFQCYQLGISSYIVKPVNFDEFKDAAQTIAKYWLQLNQPCTE